MNTTERNEILQRLAEGKITAAEAISLLDQPAEKAPAFQQSAGSVESLKANEASQIPFEDELTVEEVKAQKPAKQDSLQIVTITEDDLESGKNGNGQKPRWLKIRVRDLESGRNKVVVSLPLGVVSFGLGVARRFGVDFDDEYKIDEIWQMVKEGERGVLVDVQDEDDNEHVQIYLD